MCKRSSCCSCTVLAGWQSSNRLSPQQCGSPPEPLSRLPLRWRIGCNKFEWINLDLNSESEVRINGCDNQSLMDIRNKYSWGIIGMKCILHTDEAVVKLEVSRFNLKTYQWQSLGLAWYFLINHITCLYEYESQNILHYSNICRIHSCSIFSLKFAWLPWVPSQYNNEQPLTRRKRGVFASTLTRRIFSPKKGE